MPASPAVAAAPTNANPASSARLFRARSAIAPVTGSTSSWTPVEPASRKPNTDPACTSNPNSDTAQSRSALGQAWPRLRASASATAVR
jgi:hypothetical protein